MTLGARCASALWHESSPSTVTEPPSMRNLLVKLWRDESAVTSPEWAFIVTILVLGAVTGLVASRQAKVQTFDEPAIVRGK